jgi:NDP-sugar pyrophosphorylase family protein
MKAIILAAGKGERLKDTASGIPKPMIRFKGKPILEHNIDLCRQFAVTELFINTHHLPGVIQNYFGDGAGFGVKIRYSFETTLLGTAGAVKNFQDPLGSDPFFVIYGDNYSNYDLRLLQQEYRDRKAMAIIGFHWREDTAASGVAEFFDDGRIARFIEKPKVGESESHWVNAGVYFLNPGIMAFIPTGVSDFANDIFPRLLAAGEAMYGVCAKADVIAFDTPDMFKQSMNLNK